MERSNNEGMHTFDQQLFNLYSSGLIDYEEALRQADSANDLRLRIQLHNKGKNQKTDNRINNLNIM